MPDLLAQKRGEKYIGVLLDELKNPCYVYFLVWFIRLYNQAKIKTKYLKFDKPNLFLKNVNQTTFRDRF